MRGLTYVRSLTLGTDRLEFRDFHGSWAGDHEAHRWQKQWQNLKSFHAAGNLTSGSDPQRLDMLDVGANLGFHSILLALNVPQSRVFAVEANPLLFRLLLWNIRLNNMTERVWPLNIALSREGRGQCNPADDVLGDCVTMNVGRNHRAGWAEAKILG